VPVRIRNTSGKNFGKSELSGPNSEQKRQRAGLLSASPNLFTGNRPTETRINDVATSVGVDMSKMSMPFKKIKRMK